MIINGISNSSNTYQFSLAIFNMWLKNPNTWFPFIIEYRDRPADSPSKLNTIPDGIKVIKTIFGFYKNYKPLNLNLNAHIFIGRSKISCHHSFILSGRKMLWYFKSEGLQVSAADKSTDKCSQSGQDLEEFMVLQSVNS